MFFEGRNSHGGTERLLSSGGKRKKSDSVKGSISPKTSKKPKKTAAKPNRACATTLAETFHEFVTNRLPEFKLVHDKKTGKSEKVPLPVAKKRMVGDFQALLDDGKYSANLIQMILDWYCNCHKDGHIRTVTGFWKNLPVLIKRCERELNPYTAKELRKMTQYLQDRFIWGCDGDTLELLVGKSLFSIEQIQDAMANSGLHRELQIVRNVVGSPQEWVCSHLSEMIAHSKLDVGGYILTVRTVKRQVKGIMNRHGLTSDWVDSLDISMDRTYRRIQEERK